MYKTPIKYWVEYSFAHLYFSYCQWKWLIFVYNKDTATRADHLEKANFWYYLGSTPELDFFNSDYYKIVK